MNKKITQLAEQVAKESKLYCAFPIDMNKESYQFFAEAFAELIVRECIELCDKEHASSIHTHAGAWNTAIKRCKESIELHFGVE